MEELRELPTDTVEELKVLARESPRQLSERLKALGFSKMGIRKRIEVDLVAAAAPAAPTAEGTVPGADVSAPDNFWSTLVDESIASTSFDLSFGSAAPAERPKEMSLPDFAAQLPRATGHTAPATPTALQSVTTPARAPAAGAAAPKQQPTTKALPRTEQPEPTAAPAAPPAPPAESEEPEEERTSLPPLERASTSKPAAQPQPAD